MRKEGAEEESQWEEGEEEGLEGCGKVGRLVRWSRACGCGIAG